MTFAKLAGSCSSGRFGAAVSDIAKRTATGAQVAENHEGRGAFAEAFANVGAGGFFADGVQPVLAQDSLDLRKPFAVWRFDANP